MRFVATKRFKGYQVQFLLDESSDDLIVRAQKDDATWELLPRRILKRIIPSSFHSVYIYRYNIRALAVSLLPAENASGTPDVYWLLYRASGLTSDAAWHSGSPKE